MCNESIGYYKKRRYQEKAFFLDISSFILHKTTKNKKGLSIIYYYCTKQNT